MTDTPHLEPLPDGYTETRDSLRKLASHVLSPARKAATGRIGLRAAPGAFGTPVFGTDAQLWIDGATLSCRLGAKTDSVDITSLAAAADFAGVTLSDDPGIGNEPPPLGDVEAPLTVVPAATEAIGAWFAFSAAVLEDFRTELNAAGRQCSVYYSFSALYWRDLGFDTEGINFGCSPGDEYLADPYVYVGPSNTDGLPDGDFWNAPFGAVLAYKELLSAPDQPAAALEFLRRGAGLALQRAGEKP